MEKFDLLIAAVRAASRIERFFRGPRAEVKRAVPPPSRPREECPIPISGRPWYLAGITIGGPVADYGSHVGWKAAVRAAGECSGKDLLETAHYSCFTTMSSKIDRSRLRFEGFPLARESIDFHPWGWREIAVGGTLHAEGSATTISLDAMLAVATLENTGATPISGRPTFELLDDPGHDDEAQQPLRLSRGGRWRGSLGHDGVLRVGYRRKTGPGPLAFDETHFYRSFRLIGFDAAGDAPAMQMRWRARPFHASLSGSSITLAPGEKRTIAIIMGAGASPAEADAALHRGEASIAAAGDVDHALACVDAEWRDFLAHLPHPKAASETERRVLELAATGLRMSTFAPRGRMPGRCCVGAKVHFNIFTVWDVGFHALGLKEWDLPLAKENLTTLLTSQRRDGCIVYAIGADLRPFVPILEGVSQPPVPAIAVREVFEKDGARDVTWLRACYVRLRRWASWWERARDAGVGLFSWRNALETGWDDTPRFPNPRVPAVGPIELGNLSGLTSARHVAAVDLNAWMFAMYESLAAIARHLSRLDEMMEFEASARRLGDAVEAHLWDDERGGYFDREISPGGVAGASPAKGGKPGGAFRRALTPAVAWPLFVGLARKKERVKRLVEGLLLDPAKLFGDPEDRAAPRFPVPSVAFDDPTYGHEERGYYWRGQVWMAPSYAVLTALWRAGYAAEADRLRARILGLLAGACEGGLFEAYDARTGGIGQGSGSISGAGEPACFQIGLTTAVGALIVVRAYERYPRLVLE